MRCNHCGNKFRLSIDTAPGIFLGGAALALLAGIALWLLDVGIWPYFLFGMAGFVWLQAEINVSDYSAYQLDGVSRATCPKCEARVEVKVWSV